MESPGKVAQLVQYIADPLKKLLSIKLAHRLCIVPLGTSCNKILFYKSSILAVKMTIYWISYEVQKESQENLWPIANYFKFFLLKASAFKNSSRKKCTKRYKTDLIRLTSTFFDHRKSGLGICSLAHSALIKWVTVSNSLRSLKTNERPWANRSQSFIWFEWLWANRAGCSKQMSDRERFAQVAPRKWANERLAQKNLAKKSMF